MEFQASHSAHRPVHFRDRPPHAWQTNTVRVPGLAFGI